MPDIAVWRTDDPRAQEFMLVEATGMSEEGIEFIDAFCPLHPEEMDALDSGRILIAEKDVLDLVARVRAAGLEMLMPQA